MTILPPVVIGLTIVIQIKCSCVIPLIFVAGMLELGFLVWSLVFFYKAFAKGYIIEQERCEAVKVLRARAKKIGFVAGPGDNASDGY